jgi:hypothetical protein
MPLRSAARRLSGARKPAMHVLSHVCMWLLNLLMAIPPEVWILRCGGLDGASAAQF